MKQPLAIVCLLAGVACIYLTLKAPQGSSKPKPIPLSHYETHVPYSNITMLSKEMQKGSLKKSFNSTVHQETMWEIPKTLHFIWVGPVIREKYVASINFFSQQNPNYKV